MGRFANNMNEFAGNLVDDMMGGGGGAAAAGQ